MITHHTDAKNPAIEGGPGPEAIKGLEVLADTMAANARRAFKNAANYSVDTFERRFIEHGATCYFNCWSMLRKFLDDASPRPSAIPEEE